MARNLQALKQQYNRSGKDGVKKNKGVIKGHGPQISQYSGKPKNSKKTVYRLLSYLKGYKINSILVLFTMMVSVLSSLFGAYLLFPIINRLAGLETTIEN